MSSVVGAEVRTLPQGLGVRILRRARDAAPPACERHALATPPVVVAPRAAVTQRCGFWVAGAAVHAAADAFAALLGYAPALHARELGRVVMPAEARPAPQWPRICVAVL